MRLFSAACAAALTLPLLLRVPCPVNAQANPVADLDVTYLQRAPLYPAYCIGYNQPDMQGLPVALDPLTLQPLDLRHDAKRQPTPGDNVTFTAHVRNKGNAASVGWAYHWYIDDKPALAGTFQSPLKPGEEGKVVLPYTWQTGPHRIRFALDSTVLASPTMPLHHSLEVAADAWLLALAVDQQTYDRFQQHDNIAGTRSFEDWVQWHVAKMNALLAAPLPGPAPPAPVAPRPTIAVNALVIVPDAAQPWPALLHTPAATPLDAGYDGAWAFGHPDDIKHWAANPDYGLLHEWGHQLGLIDDDLLDRSPAQNQVPDESGDPLLLGHVSSQAGRLMYAPGDVPFSPLALAALAAQLGTRRGAYGDYIFAMPLVTVLRVLDSAGDPLPDARVTAWQDGDNARLDPVPVFSQTTDREGCLVLPNRPAPHPATPGGFTLHDNPFGQPSATGAKDVLLLRIAARGQTDTAWLDVAELNLAYFQGQRNLATVTRRTHISAPDAPPPPAALRADSINSTVVLTWDAVAAAKTYRVYRCEPRTSEWLPVGEALTDTVCKIEDGKAGAGTPDLARYAVVALSANGHESGFSNSMGVVPLVQPWGVAVLPNGRRLLRDAARSLTLLQKPDGSILLAEGSPELDLRGATDTVVDSKGRILTAISRGRADAQQGFVIQNPDLTLALTHLAAPGSGLQQVQNPMGLAVDAHDNIYLCDTDNDRIQQYGPDGKFKATLGAGLVTRPHRLVVDKQNNLIICDTGSDRLTVLRHDADGHYRLHGHANNLAHPVSIVQDAEGRYYVSCQGEHAVVALNSQFYRLPWKYTGPENNRLQTPAGLALDGKGHLLVIDAGSKRVLETRLP